MSRPQNVPSGTPIKPERDRLLVEGNVAGKAESVSNFPDFRGLPGLRFPAFISNSFAWRLCGHNTLSQASPSRQQEADQTANQFAAGAQSSNVARSPGNGTDKKSQALK